MKNVVKIIVGLLLISPFTFANNKITGPRETDGESLKMAIYFDQAAGVVNTFYEKQSGITALVRILDESGRELSSKVLGKKNDIARLSFNLSSLKDGTYTIEVSDGKEKISRTIHVEKVAQKLSNYNMQII